MFSACTWLATVACSPAAGSFAASALSPTPIKTPDASSVQRDSPGVKPIPAEPRRALDVVIAAGLRWLVTFRPEPLLRKLSGAGVDFPEPTRLAAFERSVGVHARSVTQAVVAGFDYSTLYVARLDAAHATEADTASVRFAARLDDVPVSQAVLARTLMSGIRDAEPQHFAQLSPLTLAWSEGDPSPLKAAALVSQKRLAAVPALRGASLTLLPEPCHRGDVVAYLPGPVENGHDIANAPSGVLELVMAASVALRLNSAILEVNGCVVGDWDDTGQTRVQSLLDAIVGHRLFSLFALTDAERRTDLHQDGDVVYFRYKWRAKPTLTRARALLELDVKSLSASDH